MFKNMKRIKYAVSVMLVLVLMSAVLTGCGVKSENETLTTIANATEGVLEDVVLKSGSETFEFGTLEKGSSSECGVAFSAEDGMVVEYVSGGEKLSSFIDADAKTLGKAHNVSLEYVVDENGAAVFEISTVSTLDWVLGKVDDFVWGIPLIVLILAVGLLLTVKTGLVQVFHLPKALKFMLQNEKDGEGDVSSFGALCTALSATIGTGNIVGVATAIASGGPGALFWMEFAAFLGMATKYAEGLLAVKYREIRSDGKVLGGPFYYIEKGMGPKWKWLAKMFAVFGMLVGILGIGTMTQVNGIASAVQGFFDPDHLMQVGNSGYLWPTVIAGALVTFFAALVIIGGIKRIAKVSEVVVPFMAVLYFVCGILLLVCNITKVPGAVVLIVSSAFCPKAVLGGALGITIKTAMQKGIARGIFSNESGIGSAPIAAAAAQTKEPARQGLVCMTGTFFDTIIVCTITGLSIVLTDAYIPAMNGTLEGVAITTKAFQVGLPFPDQVGALLLMVCLVFFAFTTILGWDYYSEKCLQYLVGEKKAVLMAFRILYILAVFAGPYLQIDFVWTLADIVNALMAFPNLVALFALSGVVAKETKTYIAKLKSGRLQ